MLHQHGQTQGSQAREDHVRASQEALAREVALQDELLTVLVLLRDQILRLRF